jgi:hypothetical protein
LYFLLFKQKFLNEFVYIHSKLIVDRVILSLDLGLRGLSRPAAYAAEPVVS